MTVQLNFQFNKYRDGVYPFPDDDIDPAKKNNDWHRAWCEAIYSLYYQNKTGIPYTEWDNFAELRSYSAGRQSSIKYQNFYLGNENHGKEREGWMNVNFNDIFSPAPSIVNKVQGIFQEVEHDICVDAVDERAGAEKQSMKEKLWFESVFKPELDQIKSSLGIKTEDKVLPESRDELELFADMGGFKLRYETAIEKCLEIVFHESKERMLKDKVIKDLFDLHMAATMDEVDVETQRVKQKYVDIASLIIDYSSTEEFEKATFGAIPMYYSVVELRKVGGFKEEELKALANTYLGYYGNPKQWNNSLEVWSNGAYGYDNFRIPVLYAAWKSLNKEFNVKKKDSRGNDKVYPSKFGRYWDTDNKSTIISDTWVIYNAKWIVGTDKVFEYGMMNDIPREGREARLPFHVYKLPGKSPMECMKPILDDIQMIKLRYQNAVAQSPPPGLAIEWGSLENIVIGAKKMSPYEVLKMYRQNGNLVYKQKNINNGSASAKPVSELVGGMGTILNETVGALDMAFRQLSQVSGIDPLTLSVATPNRDMQVGTANIASASTDTSLKMLYAAYLSIKESFARNAAYRIQLICKYNKDENKGYYGAIGKASVEAIAEAGDKDPIQFGFKIQARPTENEKQEILQAAVASMQVGKSGGVGISMSDYMFISHMIKTGGGIKYARAYLAYKEQKAEQAKQAIAQQNSQMNGQVAIQTEEAKGQIEKDRITHEYDNKIRFEAAKALFATIADTEKADKQAEQIAVQLVIKEMGKQAQIEAQADIKAKQAQQPQQQVATPPMP